MSIFGIMKKIFLAFAILAGMTLLTGCFGTNNETTPTAYDVTTGAVVVSAGDPVKGIPGHLDYIDFRNNRVSDVAFNFGDKTLGDRPNDILIYGGKIYVAVCDDHVVHVFGKTSFQRIETISTTEEMGDQEGFHPRRLVPYNGKVYVSTQGGYVGVIDTLSLSVRDKYRVGSYPEGMSIGVKDNVPFLYVANSDDGFGHGSISTINLSSGTVSEFKNEKIPAPVDLAVAGDEIYVLDQSGVYLVVGTSVSSLIPNASGMYAVGYDLLTYNTPGSPDAELTYTLYNLTYSTLSSFHLSGDYTCPIINPTTICIDSVSGYVMIGSQVEGSEEGYVNMYTGSGAFVASYKTGFCPIRVAFIHETVEM